VASLSPFRLRGTSLSLLPGAFVWCSQTEPRLPPYADTRRPAADARHRRRAAAARVVRDARAQGRPDLGPARAPPSALAARHRLAVAARGARAAGLALGAAQRAG